MDKKENFTLNKESKIGKEAILAKKANFIQKNEMKQRK